MQRKTIVQTGSYRIGCTIDAKVPNILLGFSPYLQELLTTIPTRKLTLRHSSRYPDLCLALCQNYLLMLSTLSHDDGSKEGWYLGIIFFETISSVCGTRKKKKKKGTWASWSRLLRTRRRESFFLCWNHILRISCWSSPASPEGYNGVKEKIQTGR